MRRVCVFLVFFRERVSRRWQGKKREVAIVGVCWREVWVWGQFLYMREGVVTPSNRVQG